MAAVLAAFVLAQGAPARSDAAPAAWRSKTVIVGYTSDAALRDALRGRPATIVRVLPEVRAVEVRPKTDPAGFAAALAGSRGIDYVQPPAARRSLVEPGLAPAAVPGGAYQWQFSVTHADRVPAGPLQAAFSTTIAVIDSGFDLSAPDLAAKRPSVYNAINDSTDVTDTVGHGTFVASLAAGSSTNGEGIAGVGGEARLIGIKAGGGFLSDFDIAAAITYAVDHGARVINLSLGGRTGSVTELRAIQYAVVHDVLLVAAAGNEHDRGNPVEYPAAYLQPVGSNGQGGIGLAVGASTISGTRASFSNTGSYISLAAPGENVFGAVSKNSSPKMFPRVRLPGSSSGLYGYSSGTSFSAPQVAGAAALVWAANEQLSARQVADILKATASGHGAWNPELGYGVIDVEAAVAAARTTPAVSMKVSRGYGSATLSWSGTAPAQSFRLLEHVGKNPDRVLVDATTKRSFEYATKDNDTHVLTVEALDAAGNVVARSAGLHVTLGQAKSSLELRGYRFKYQGKRYSIILARLEPKAPDVAAGNRTIVLEQLTSHGWQWVNNQATDGGGRAIWTVPRGSFRVRVTFPGARDLAGAKTKAVLVRG
ncbi:MAG TPA: S8 family serine peptidase [Gaiellaceae bacterium]|nr:S8 family serine peptidase [Gaiellaceae bacterium]